MIDDNEEEEDDEEEEEEEEAEGEVEGGGPGSAARARQPLIPSPSLEEPHKHRPTTLHLTTLGAQVSRHPDPQLSVVPSIRDWSPRQPVPPPTPESWGPSSALLSSPRPSPPPQDSLNNNGGFAPGPPASRQETVLCPPAQEPLRGELGGGGRGYAGGEGGRGGGGGLADPTPCSAEPPAPLPPTDRSPCGAQSPVHPGCDSEGNQPARPLAPGGASPSSDPGIEADLGSGSSGGRGGRRSSQELSSPGSDSEDAGGARLGRMISSISETELERSSDDGGSSSGRSSHLTNSIEEASSPASEPEPEPPCEPPRRPAFLPVGPDDTNSEYESGSESEPDLSEDADSPWLLSNLVSRMISEGSSPIRCPGQCLSPAPRPAGECASPVGEAPEAAAGPGVELVDMETLCGPPPPEPSAPRPGPAQPGPCLFLSNPTRDTITPLWAAPGRPARPGRACSAACSEEDDEDEEEEDEAEPEAAPLGGRGTGAAPDASLVYDAVKYTLVVDEHTQLELVSLRRCARLGEDSGDSGGEASEEEAGAALLGLDRGPGAASPDSPDLTFSKKFLNVFVNSTSRSSSEWEVGKGGGPGGAGWLLGPRASPRPP